VLVTNLPASTEFPAHSVDCGRVVLARVGRGRLASLLVLVAATEFLLVGLFSRRPLSSAYPPAPNANKYIPEFLLISALQCSFHSAPAIFRISDEAPPRVPMERHQPLTSAIPSPAALSPSPRPSLTRCPNCSAPDPHSQWRNHRKTVARSTPCCPYIRSR
jgi:hypothetical protein